MDTFQEKLYDFLNCIQIQKNSFFEMLNNWRNIFE